MATSVEIDRISGLLDQATLRQGVWGVVDKPIPVARISEDAELVYGVFPYQRRVIDVSGRALTYDVTRQPVLAVREGKKVTPLPYAEDVTKHPLRERLEDTLKALSFR